MFRLSKVICNSFPKRYYNVCCWLKTSSEYSLVIPQTLKINTDHINMIRDISVEGQIYHLLYKTDNKTYSVLTPEGIVSYPWKDYKKTSYIIASLEDNNIEIKPKIEIEPKIEIKDKEHIIDKPRLKYVRYILQK
uniref:Uncharacterized protein n=1 Tax=viral metagenome TaxID=1070528 RepID=A0A6C0J7B2_9ZZZZ